MTTATLRAQYAVQDDRAESYPWIQASNYQPRLKDTVHLCITQDSIELLSEESQQKICKAGESIALSYGDDEQVGVVVDSCRWVILCRPRPFVFNKDTNEYEFLQKGVKFGSSRKGVMKIHLACIVGDEILTDANGDIQVFTLKLKGMKTTWANGSEGSIDALNKGLCKHYGINRSWLTHLASVELKAYPERFTSKSSGESSVAVMFGFGKPGAKPLSEQEQAMTYALVSSEDFQAAASDPFGIKTVAETEEKAEPATEEGHSYTKSAVYAEEADYDKIPF